MPQIVIQPPDTDNEQSEVITDGSYTKDAVVPEQYTIENGVLATPAQKRFYASEQCEVARTALEQMVNNPSYNTESSYFRESALDFVERHLHYLSTHPATNVAGYLSNLRLMTKVKQR